MRKPHPMSSAKPLRSGSMFTTMMNPEITKMMVLKRWPTIDQNSCMKCSMLGSMRTLPYGDAKTRP